MWRRFKADMKKYLRYSIISAKSQLKSEIANSYLNWFWWILDPVCFMLIYTFMFGYVFKAREAYFPIFIFIGLSMWDFFNRMMNTGVKIVKDNKAIVTKVYLPKYILIMTKLWNNGFKMMISFGIVFAMMLVWRVPITLNLLWFFPILMILGIFTFGCAAHLAHYGVFVEDLSNVISICLRLIFYMTGIFYNVETRIPAPYGEMLTKGNPMAFLLQSMRGAMLYGKTPHRKLLLFWLLVSLMLAWTGIRKIYKNENSYVKVI
ncbi:polysaccharide ABC transporter [Clostridium sp. AF18-27]|nr:polysaccharide ABC transporter [Clostridium sp. AF18-27]